MGYVLGERSKRRLNGVHPDLVAVVELAIQLSEQDFSISEGLRSLERQRKLVNAGKSQTLYSRHITGHAVDLLPYPFNGDVDEDGIPNIEDWDQYYPIADAMIRAAQELNIAIRWGGNWQVQNLLVWEHSARGLSKAYTGKFRDGPHFELSREVYP